MWFHARRAPGSLSSVPSMLAAASDQTARPPAAAVDVNHLPHHLPNHRAALDVPACRRGQVGRQGRGGKCSVDAPTTCLPCSSGSIGSLHSCVHPSPAQAPTHPAARAPRGCPRWAPPAWPPSRAQSRRRRAYGRPPPRAPPRGCPPVVCQGEGRASSSGRCVVAVGVDGQPSKAYDLRCTLHACVAGPPSAAPPTHPPTCERPERRP